MTTTKVVHMSSVHPSNDVRVFAKECQTLASAGLEVVYVVPADEPTCTNGVRIHAIRQRHGRLRRMTLSVWAVYRAALAEAADVYHFHDPELIPAALLLKVSRIGCRIAYDVHEDMPRSVMGKYWIPAKSRKLVAQAVRVVESIAVKGIDGVIAATPSIARNYPQGKTALVQNFPMLDEFLTGTGEDYYNREPVVIHTGRVSVGRGGHEMVRAMSKIPFDLHARLVLAGMFVPTNYEQDLAKEKGWGRIEFLGWKSRKEMNQLLSKARIGLVLLHPEENYVEAQPNKLFEYMAAGLPVVASDFPRWREIVLGADCGLLVDPLDPQAIADAIRWLLEHPQEAKAMGERGRRAVEEQYNWHRESETLVSFYRTRLLPRTTNPTMTASSTASLAHDKINLIATLDTTLGAARWDRPHGEDS